MNDTYYRWGRGRRTGGELVDALPHRVQHAWRIITDTGRAIPMCLGPCNRSAATIDFHSDAARCERCAARLKRREAAAAGPPPVVDLMAALKASLMEAAG